MAPTAVKRAKISHIPATQSSLKDLFAKQSTSPVKEIPTKTREEEELEWAIRESLKESGNVSNSILEATSGAAEIDDEDEVKTSWSDSRESSSASSSHTSIQSEQHLNSKRSLPTIESFAAPPVDLECAPEASIEAEASSSKSQFNAFSRLMSSHSEAKEWAASDAAESRNSNIRFRQRRTAPFYKILTGMPICVDGFRFGTIAGCKAYFLSHFHADHYGGITSAWEGGPIYCSQTTANLVRTSLHVQESLICPLPFDMPTTIPGTGGVKVTLLDANHCPGSSLFLFEGPQTCHILPPPSGSTRPAIPPPSIIFRYLHCGDFRASPRHTNHPLIKGKRLDIIYLDTTYCNPRYCFPAQEMVINACADMVRRVAPEQCKLEVTKSEEEEEEPDWRIGPLKGKKLKDLLEEEMNKPSVEAMKGWLNGSIIKGEIKDEDDDLGDLEFKDEEIEFKREDQMGDVEDEADEDVSQEPQECDDGRAPDVKVKEEYEEDVFEEEPESGLSVAIKQESSECNSVSKSIKKEEPASQSDLIDIKPQSKPQGRRILVVVGTYTIGKEKIVVACAKALRTKVYCADPRKYRVYAQIEDPELHSLLTRDPLKAHVHVTSLMTINGEALQEHTSKMRALGMHIDRAIAFRPTGWTYKPPAGSDLVSPALDRVIAWNQSRQFSWLNFTPTRDSTKEYSIYGVPYSEHSSFFELSAFAMSVDYVRIIATVNVGNPTSRAKMARWFEKWKAEKKRRNYKPVESRTADYF